MNRVPLSELVKFVGGGTPRRDRPDFWNGEIPWVSCKDLNGALRISSSQESITEEGLRSSASNLIPAGSLLIATRMSLGKAVINEVPVAINQDLKAALCSPRLDTRYLLWFWLSQAATLSRLGSGATVKGVTLDQVSNITIPLLPLEEQKRIAAILDKADAIRRKREQAIQLADEFLRSLFLDMFGDPVRNPKGWPVDQLGNAGGSRLGKMLDQKRQTGHHRRPYLRNANVQWGRIAVGNLMTMDFDSKDREEFRLKAGDVLVCEGGEPGRAAIWRSEIAECYFQKALHRFRPDPARLVGEYMISVLLFKSERGGLKDYVTTATIAHLTGEKFKTLPITLPPIALQKQFEEVAIRARRISKVSVQARAVDREATSALSLRAFRGEL